MNEEFFIPPHLRPPRPPLRIGRRPKSEKDLNLEQLEVFRRLDPKQQVAYRTLFTRFGEKKIRKNKSPVNGLSGSGFKEWLNRVLGIKPKSKPKPESPSTPPPDPSSHFSENELMEMLGYKNEKKEKNKPASEESGGKKKRKRRNIQ